MAFKIVVMGGSFNPPTLAHKIIMQSAVDCIDAQMGIFVPVSHAYLKRKLRKDGGRICFSEEDRMKMLNIMCADDKRLSASDMEYGSFMVVTYDTLGKLQKRYPEAELYFLSGADKKKIIMDWAAKGDFLEKYHLIIVGRDGVDFERDFLEESELLDRRESFVFLQQPEGIDHISSTAVRKRMNLGESLEGFVQTEVMEMLDGISEKDFPEEIERFTEEYDFLSNICLSPFIWEGITWKTAENAFQASKFSSPDRRKEIALMSADKAKQRGNIISVSKEWEDEKVEIMESILRAKFSQNPDLEEKLIGTGDKILINGNNGKDLFWGIDRYSFCGENHLGKILMKIREERIQEQKKGVAKI